MLLLNKLLKSAPTRPLNNESGFALILTMVMLATMSILGVMVLNTTNTELAITGNSRADSDAFVAAELATEYAQVKVVDTADDIVAGTNYDLLGDDDIDDILPLVSNWLPPVVTKSTITPAKSL